ncbi:MAG: hypothetical protein ACUVRN_08675, partial [Candidatus Caldatribacteriaceae bacterium]
FFHHGEIPHIVVKKSHSLTLQPQPQFPKPKVAQLLSAREDFLGVLEALEEAQVVAEVEPSKGGISLYLPRLKLKEFKPKST